jgi:hypothetical protein
MHARVKFVHDHLLVASRCLKSPLRGVHRSVHPLVQNDKKNTSSYDPLVKLAQRNNDQNEAAASRFVYNHQHYKYCMILPEFLTIGNYRDCAHFKGNKLCESWRK